MFATCFATLLLSAPTRNFALCNLAVQLAIFLPFANLPAWPLSGPREPLLPRVATNPVGLSRGLTPVSHPPAPPPRR